MLTLEITADFCFVINIHKSMENTHKSKKMWSTSPVTSLWCLKRHLLSNNNVAALGLSSAHTLWKIVCLEIPVSALLTCVFGNMERGEGQLWLLAPGWCRAAHTASGWDQPSPLASSLRAWVHTQPGAQFFLRSKRSFFYMSSMLFAL